MVKKILILSAVFLGLSSMAIIEATKPEEIVLVEGQFEPIVVLELFTSQGCSSCPPADVLLDRAKKQHPNNVFALSYHVDYWNYIGWEDPFSSKQYTTKQSFYNRKLGYRGNYTPEMVINGREHFVGSNGAKVNAKITQYGKIKAENGIDLSGTKRNGNSLTFDFKVVGNLKDKLLRAVLVLDERTTVVKRGENRNRTLTNSNIVVLENYLEAKGGEGSTTLEIPASVGSDEDLTLMLFVETDELDITGAVKRKV
ncbi:MAG: DUF1223 domain-containing protein [Bacteroidota bacterium]